MAKSKFNSRVKTPKSALPKAPWIYMNNTIGTGQDVAKALAALIPHAVIAAEPVELDCNEGCVSEIHILNRAAMAFGQSDAVVVILDQHADINRASSIANGLRETAIQHGNNFTSVNLTNITSTGPDNNRVDWGTNHLQLNTAALDAGAAADKIFKWLFKVLTVAETLHLILEADMLATDTKMFPDYAYCAIKDSRKHPKDAKIQFVALIASKPEVCPDQRLTWKVVDRTGEANFYFKYRSSDSKATWDWVLKLQPGDRKALPRMPMVQIKEKKRVKVLKAPFRGAAAVVGGVGLTVRGVGKGLCWISDKVRMGPSGGEWVAEADLPKDARVENVDTSEKKEIKIFNEKGGKAWKDDDGASTTADSIFDEKIAKDFC